MEKEYNIPSAQTSMKVDDFNTIDDPSLDEMIKYAKEDENYQEIIRCVKEGLNRAT